MDGMNLGSIELCQFSGQERYTVQDIASRLDTRYQRTKESNPRGYKDQFESQFGLHCTEIAQELGARCFEYPGTTIFDWTNSFHRTSRYRQLEAGLTPA